MAILKYFLVFLFLFCVSCGTVLTTGVSHTAKAVIDKRAYSDQWKDSILEKKLRYELVGARDIRSSTISAIVFLKKAYLTGIVRNKEEVFRILKICNELGIPDSDIVSNLIVDKTSINRQTKDSYMTAKIKAVYLKDKELSAINIHVATVNGRVILVGLVDNAEQWKRAEKIAARAGGEPIKNYILLKENIS